MGSSSSSSSLTLRINGAERCKDAASCDCWSVLPLRCPYESRSQRHWRLEAQPHRNRLTHAQFVVPLLFSSTLGWTSTFASNVERTKLPKAGSKDNHRTPSASCGILPRPGDPLCFGLVSTWQNAKGLAVELHRADRMRLPILNECNGLVTTVEGYR